MERTGWLCLFKRTREQSPNSTSKGFHGEHGYKSHIIGLHLQPLAGTCLLHRLIQASRSILNAQLQNRRSAWRHALFLALVGIPPSPCAIRLRWSTAL